MTASEHLSPQQFFHGSPFEHEDGHVLTPEAAAQHPGFANYDLRHGNPIHVYFTDSLDHAQGYAKSQSRLNESGGRNVYEVHPLGDVEPDPYDHSGHAYRSATGARVVRKIGAGQ